MATYITCIQRNMMISYLAEFSLFNMALFYQPAPAVISKMLVSFFINSRGERCVWVGVMKAGYVVTGVVVCCELSCLRPFVA